MPTICDFCHAPAERIVQRDEHPQLRVATCTGECLARVRRACVEAGIRHTVTELVSVEVDRPWGSTDLGVTP